MLLAILATAVQPMPALLALLAVKYKWGAFGVYHHGRDTGAPSRTQVVHKKAVATIF